MDWARILAYVTGTVDPVLSPERAEPKRSLRKALEGNDMRGKHGDPLVQTLTTQGYFLNLEAADIRLVN